MRSARSRIAKGVQAPGQARREHGFAIVLVLWTLTLLALITTQIAARGSLHTRLAGNLVVAAKLQAAADSAVETTLFGLLANQRPPENAGEDAQVEVRVEDQAGKINPNVASLELLEGLLKVSGFNPLLAERILDWRTDGRYPRRNGAKAEQYRVAGRDFGPSGEPFRSLDELALVLGLTPGIVSSLKPDLTLIYRGDPVPTLASPRAREAMDLARLLARGKEPSPQTDPARAVCITAVARGRVSGEARTRACVRLDARQREQPWQIVEWSAGRRNDAVSSEGLARQ